MKQTDTAKTGLSEAEICALQQLKASSKGISLSGAPQRTTITDFHTEISAALWKRLIKKGLVLSPEEDAVTMEDGSDFTFTSFLEITDEGEAALQQALQSSRFKCA